MPKDLLTITVNTSDQESSEPFNLTVQTSLGASSRNVTSSQALQQYLVDNDGNIKFPVLGTLHLVGMTKGEAEAMIREKLKPYLIETPIVNVRMTNYKISVLGEVASPGIFTVSNEKINVLEALAQAGDLTVYGLRDNVRLIREDAEGKQHIYTLNLNDANLVLSPYYYLQQNDILYVTPNKTKAKNSDIGSSTTLWFSATSILISLTSLLYNILR
jgi:polysaccharide export outer membrane protein